MKRLPSEDELRDTVEVIGVDLGKIGGYDLERVMAAIEARLWECRQDAVGDLEVKAKPSDYYAGGIHYLTTLLNGFEAIARTKGQN